jgi:3-hydroxyisobutyrate dehydrogenase-like beta-hydroxyacid dehydrogenase
MGRLIGLLNPGEMGAGIGGALVRSGHSVSWVASGRSAASATRATAAGFEPLSDLGALTERAEIVISIVPPHAALDVATQVAGFEGLFVDANAISPKRAGEVAAVIEQHGGTYVDGGIIGSPPPGAVPRFGLSGPGASEIAALFTSSEVRTRVLDGDRYRASALKMSFAAWTKGSRALLLAIRALARATGVEDELVSEWSDHSPDLLKSGRRAAAMAEERGWRWVGEMGEIADSFRSVGLPGGFYDAAGEIYRRVTPNRDGPEDEATLAAVLDALLSDR